ncbi:MAG TPA: hypothetical protein VGJ06_03745 [Candidatus Acidoferrum sp.]|jgi:hypothetical protein
MTATDPAADRKLAFTATGDDLTTLLHHPATEVLLAVLDNPALDETQLCLLLDRKDLPAEILEEVATRKNLLKNYRVKRALAFHPHTPRLASLRFIKDLYLMDLAQLALSVGVPTELKRIAEEQLLARLSQLPLGQKITLARRGPGRVAGALLAEGHPQILSVVLDNAYLTEAQVLKALAREKLSAAVVHAIAQHRRWSCIYSVRLALIRAPGTTLATVLAFLPEINATDLHDLSEPGIVSAPLRNYLQAELARRSNPSE